MTAPQAAASYAARMPERELQQLVADLCRWLQLPMFHVHYAKHMEPGWPDCVILGSRVLFRELKAEHGRLTPDQRDVGDRLKAAGQDWSVWRPRDWLSGDIEKQLRQLIPPPTLPFGEVATHVRTGR